MSPVLPAFPLPPDPPTHSLLPTRATHHLSGFPLLALGKDFGQGSEWLTIGVSLAHRLTLDTYLWTMHRARLCLWLWTQGLLEARQFYQEPPDPLLFMP